MSSRESPVKVLVVDEVGGSLAALRRIIDAPDVELLAARTVPEALELLLVHDVALALIDVPRAAELRAFEFAGLMRQEEQTRKIPMVLLAESLSECHHVLDGYETGAVDYCFKPIDPPILRHKVSTFIQLHRQRRELERLSEELSRTLHLHDTFIAALSHDLRNPLGAIMIGVEVLLAHPLDQERSRRAAERIRSSGRRMTAMLEDLLGLANARLGGGVPMDPQSVDLLAVARKAVLDHEGTHGGRVVEVTSVGDVTGSFDRAGIEQVTSNLLSNALRHGDKRFPVTISLDGTRADDIRLRVQNPGTLDAEILQRLLDPSSMPDAGASGLRLGLHIVDQIVRRHGGRVTARSSPEDGVIFEVQLPRRPTALVPVPPPPWSPRPPTS